jgi:hypothetical protein
MYVVFQAISPLINEMLNMEFFQLLFPFLLALAIFYGVLYFVFHAGERKMPKSAIGLISIILAFFVMLYASWNPSILAFFTSLSGATLILGSGILIIAVLLGLIGFNIEGLTTGSGWSKWVFILGIIALGILIFFGAGGSVLGLVPPELTTNGQFLTAVFVIIIIALAVWFLSREDGGGGGAGSQGQKPSG